jgi:HEXXH motif-containing protein
VTTTHQITVEDFDALAAGYGGTQSIRSLRDGQLSKRLHLLQALRDLNDSQTVKRADISEVFDLLSCAYQAAPDIASEILLYPFLDYWSVTSLRRLGSGQAIDLGYLGGIAAVAAARAGIKTRIRVPVHNGGVMLPGLGHLATSDAQVVLDTKLLAEGTYSATGWQPVRGLSATAGGRELRVRIDDRDPHRHILDGAVATLRDAELSRWSDTLSQAWNLLASDHHIHYPEGLAAGLHTLVPLKPSSNGRARSSSSPQAFGAIALSTRDDATWTALLMIHELQHTKLSALMDMVDLYDSDHPQLYHAPWRPDPRPIGALFQGVYAHLGVVDFWRVQRHAMHQSKKADFQFAFWRELTGLAISSLIYSDALTELGRRFVLAISTTLEAWSDESVPPSIARASHKAALRNSELWRIRTRLSPVHG